MASTIGEVFENLSDVISNYKPYVVAYNETLKSLRESEVQISKNICELINHGHFSTAKEKTTEHKVICEVIELMESALYDAQYYEEKEDE